MNVSLHLIDGFTVCRCVGADGGISVVVECDDMTATFSLDALTVKQMRDRRVPPSLRNRPSLRTPTPEDGA